MFCDSDFITTLTWAKILFNYENIELENFLKQKHNNYFMTFLFYPDTTWIQDTHRQTSHSSNEFRIHMFHIMENMLIKFNRPYIVLTGNYSDKENNILQFINNNSFN